MAQRTFTYCFSDIVATLQGPGGSISLGAGAGNAEEAISIEFTEETDTMLIGADGGVAHSLHASKAGKVSIKLLKTSPTNQQLTSLYNFQRTSSLFHGQNTLVISNTITGDVYTCTQAAFAKFPGNVYAKEAGTIDWEFNCGRIEPILGGAGLLIT